MADAGLGHGRPAEMDTGILQVLTGYIAQGGQLYGARRWVENPLTLTHVRWQGPGGVTVDAFRRPDIDETGGDAERQVWVQLALTMPTSYGAPSGANAPWLPLAVMREKAMEWVQALRQLRSSRHSQAQRPSGGDIFSSPRIPAIENDLPRRSGSAFGPSSFPERPARSSYMPPHSSAPSMPLSVDMEPTMQYTTAPNTPPHISEENRQFTNSWRQSQVNVPEVVVVPCVDVELPPAMDGMASADYRNDFARDVALHFSRAARAIPQVREVRGWMRGNRIVLAARFVVAVGTRPPTRAEMDGAAQILADGLAQRTLPYVRLGFADPGEWTQGAPLPE